MVYSNRWKNMSTTGKWILGIIGIFCGVAFVIVAIALFGLTSAIVSVDSSGDTFEESNGTGVDQVAVVEIDAPIIDSKEVVRQLRKYQKRQSVKAIVLRLNSPGGGVVPSHEIYEEVRRTKERGKPVIVSMGSVAASGAYYIACGASRIVSNPGTITGSIGVISQFMNFKALMDKVGVESTTIKSGKFKDAGNPTRKMTDEDISYFQSTIMDVYEQFLDVVSKSRSIPLDTLRLLADGRVFTGQQAYAHGLVDTLGTYQTAISIAGVLGRVQGEPRIVQEKKKSTFIDMFFGNTTSKTLNTIQSQLDKSAPVEYKLNY
jgi:protease IV